MRNGRLLAAGLILATLILAAIGTVHPVASAAAYAGGSYAGSSAGSSAGSRNILRAPSTPQAAVENLATAIRVQAWDRAYASLANKAEFSQADFRQDLSGHALSLRTYATLNDFEVRPLHQSADEAELTIRMRWSSVLGAFDEVRTVHAVRNGDRWSVLWPLVKEKRVPPQVVPVNYLRWDVIYRGPEDEWGAQDVEAPHVRIVDMHPVSRAAGAVVMGELLNEDIVPAFVSVRATLVAKNGSILASSGSFDMILHTLLPKQVTPFTIQFPDVELSQVGSIRMEPVSTLVPASADPVVSVENQTFNPGAGASLTGQISNQSGQTVNVAHVLSTFYDKNGQVVWVGGQYIDRALQPGIPLDFRVAIPTDLAKQISNQRTVVSTYSAGTSQ